MAGFDKELLLDSQRAMRPKGPKKLHQVERCVVQRRQHHPTKPNLTRLVQCRRPKRHPRPCDFEPVPKAEPEETKRPRCDTSVHPMVSLATGICSLKSCGFKGCRTCMERHIKGDGCPSETWRPYL